MNRSRTRRHSVRVAGIAAILALVAAACGEEPAQGGDNELHWVIPTEIDMLDPQASFSLTTGMVVGRNIFDRLVEQNEQLEIVPRLATDWEVSEDGTTWTFNLREGVEFHDGTPFNADAVVFTIERAIDPDNGLVAGSFAWGGVTEVEPVDDYTVRIHTEHPVAAFLANIADGGLGSIISPSSVTEGGEFVPIGTGAFRFVRWDPTGDLVLERNDDYWDQLPSYQRLVVTPSTEGSTRVNQLQAGDADLISLVPIPQIDRVKAAENIVLRAEPATTWVYIAMNNQRSPFTDVRVRQAFNYAVNKKSIIENTLGGLGRVPDSPIGSGYSVHTSVMTYDHDPARARDLLEAAGWRLGPEGIRQKNGERLEATLRYGEGNIEEGAAVAQAVASMLADVGADITVEPMEFSVFSEANRQPLEESEVDMAMARFGTGDPDTGMGSTLHSESWPPDGNNYAFYANPEVDAALDAGARVFDMAQRRPHYERAQELVMRDAPWIFLTERQEAIAWRDHVSGVRFIPTSAGLIDVRSVTLGGS